MSQFRIETLSEHHDRRGFQSTSAALDRYFANQVSQDLRRHVAACLVAVPVDEPDTVAGFYTLSAGGVVLADLPAQTTKKLPRYPTVPVARMGRLAVAQRFAGVRLGRALVWDACRRALQSQVAAFALVVDAKDEQAAAFYRHIGFLEFGSDPLQLFFPLASLQA